MSNKFVLQTDKRKVNDNTFHKSLQRNLREGYQRNKHNTACNRTWHHGGNHDHGHVVLHACHRTPGRQAHGKAYSRDSPHCKTVLPAVPNCMPLDHGWLRSRGAAVKVEHRHRVPHLLHVRDLLLLGGPLVRQHQDVRFDFVGVRLRTWHCWRVLFLSFVSL